MSDSFRATWETYASSWGEPDVAKKRALFENSLDPNCVYNDPLTKIRGWNELESYMLDFNEKVPGGHFVVTRFLTHSNKSIAIWEMKNGENTVLSNGISYGEYNEAGKLVAMTGFFEQPEF